MLCLRMLSILWFFSFLSSQTIVGSKHDFTASGFAWYTSDEICIICHTPHTADLTVAEAPLWNHEVTSATFTPYSSTTFDAQPGQPDGVTKLCLGCHDGTTAVDSWGGTTGEIVWPSFHGDVMGTNLGNDHPVSFTYDAALASADGELADPTAVSSGLGGTIADDMLTGGKIQCNSCHDVHNGTGLEYLLVKSNAGSGLCLTCHEK